MKRTLTVTFTVWLIAQAVLPFTPPFAVCALGDLLDVAPQGSQLSPPAHPSGALLTDAAYASTPPLATAAGRLKLVVVSLSDASSFVRIPPQTAGRSIASLSVPRPTYKQPSVLRV